MKYALVFIALLFTFGFAWADDLRLVMAKNGKTIDLKTLAKDLAKYDLIFFGEYHDNQDIHKLQRDLLPLLSAKSELILSFEMFERDVQSVLDSYLAGTISETEFLGNSRPWGNYETDYRPLVEYAKQHGLKAIAANVPRRHAGKMARVGIDFLEELEPEERSWIAGKPYFPADAYQTAFYATMDGMSGHGMNSMVPSLELLYQAQCLKDDTMAESIVKALQNNPKALLIHFNGEFHSRNFLGTVSRVQSALPKLKIAVISPSYRSDWQTAKLSTADKATGTHLILLPEPVEGGEQ